MFDGDDDDDDEAAAEARAAAAAAEQRRATIAAHEAAKALKHADPSRGCRWVRCTSAPYAGAVGSVVGTTSLCKFVDFGGDAPCIPLAKKRLLPAEPADRSHVGATVIVRREVAVAGTIEAVGRLRGLEPTWLVAIAQHDASCAEVEREWFTPSEVTLTAGPMCLRTDGPNYRAPAHAPAPAIAVASEPSSLTASPGGSSARDPSPTNPSIDELALGAAMLRDPTHKSAKALSVAMPPGSSHDVYDVTKSVMRPKSWRLASERSDRSSDDDSVF